MYKIKNSSKFCNQSVLYGLVIIITSVCLMFLGLEDLRPQYVSSINYSNLKTDVITDLAGNSSEMYRVVDWDKLKKKNKDIVGWVYIPNSKVDYPILKGTKADYYLNHDYKKDYNKVGSIFLENKTKINDPHYVLFGHNMASGNMFGDLSEYESKKYLKSHMYVYVYTKNKVREYKVISAMQVGSRDDVYSIGYEYNTKEYKNLIKHIKPKKYKGKISADTQTVTLSTCVSSRNRRYRYVVNCILVNELKKN